MVRRHRTRTIATPLLSQICRINLRVCSATRPSSTLYRYFVIHVRWSFMSKTAWELRRDSDVTPSLSSVVVSSGSPERRGAFWAISTKSRPLCSIAKEGRCANASHWTRLKPPKREDGEWTLPARSVSAPSPLRRSESSHRVFFLIDKPWPVRVERTAISAEPDGIGQIPNLQSGQSAYWR